MEAAGSKFYLHLARVPCASRLQALLLQRRDASKLSNVLAAHALYFGAKAAQVSHQL